MPSYKYQVRTARGELQMGVVHADNATAAASALRAQGVRVLSVAPANASLRQSSAYARFKEMNAGKH